MIEVGKILQNRYRIEKQIGQGGMGKVYVASDERFNSTVAIKETIFEDTNLRRAFEREARLLNSLKHQALPRVSDHFNEDDGQFLVMEFVAGEDLAEMMERAGTAFPVEKVLNWANQLCDALEYLHAQDIIHRDIKPQNLKLTPGGQIVLLDFGLAKGNPTDSNNLTAAKSIFGYSRSYASLEQIQGTGTEPRSDLYSLAATIYHLLTGIPPADALTRAMNVLNKQPDPLVPANILNKNIPIGVANVLQSAMALNASERPAAASDLKQMLDESDKYVDLNVGENRLSTASTADLLSQETKIKPLASRITHDSRVATKIISGTVSGANSYQTTIENDDSVVTKIRPAESPNYPPKRKKAVGIALAGALLIGTAFSGIYFLSSDGKQNGFTENGNSVPTNFTIQTQISENSSNVVAGNTDNTTVAAENSSNQKTPKNTAVKTISTDAVNKNTQTAKSQPRPSKSPQNNESEAFTTTDENGIKWTIRENSIESDNVIIDDNGVRVKNPQKRVFKRSPTVPLPPQVFQRITPEQMEKLKNLEKMQKNRVIIVKTPTPVPTP